MIVGSNRWGEGIEHEPAPVNVRDTLSAAGSEARAEVDLIVALVDRQADAAFASKVWTVGEIFRESDENERAALVEFVNKNWGGK